MDAAAAQDVTTATVAAVPDLFDDIDYFNLDDFDFDLAADEFCDAYAAFVANADKSGEPAGGWLAGSGIDVGDCDGGSGRGSCSPESAVTDGPDAAEEEGALSAYVCELERFLLGNGCEDDGLDDVAAAPPDGAGAAEEEEPISVDDYLFGDDLLAGHGSDDAAAGVDAGEEESLAAREDDESASRKRARHKIKGTTMTPCSWGERHLAPMQVPPLWLRTAPALLCV